MTWANLYSEVVSCGLRTGFGLNQGRYAKRVYKSTSTGCARGPT